MKATSNNGLAVTELLRFATAGSVDDGKSTLIGRLLHDSKSIFEDQMQAVERWSTQRGHDEVNLALLTDGLRAEREQGITIDVAYRYFATPRRKFIIADTPGHVQYTRNMVTGASTADLAVVLVDARKGVLEQSRRHAAIASLLGIRCIVVAVNKMDLVGWDAGVFDAIRKDFTAFAERLDIPDLRFIPLSALHGDNVVDRSGSSPWYEGPTLLELLETVDVASPPDSGALRFPVQYVIRPGTTDHHDYRGYAGTVAGGTVRPGDDVVVLPSGLRTAVASVETFDGSLPEAPPATAVTVRLRDELDVSRGDMLVSADGLPTVTRELLAVVCWFAEGPLAARRRYSLKHTTRTVRAVVDAVVSRLDVDTLAPDGTAGELAVNDIGRVRLRLSAPVVVDAYADNRTTGSFILIDEATNATVGAGIVLAPEA